MPLIKNRAQIDLMRESGRIVAKTLRIVSARIEPGITTQNLNDWAEELIRQEGGIPSFLNYRGFPAAACISVNDEVVHGIPGSRKLAEGDLVSLDFGVVKNGWHADGAWTYAVGTITPEAKRLMSVTREALMQGMAKAKPGNTLGDIGAAVQRYVEQNSYGVVRDLVGHGIGEKLHDEPHNVAMYGKPGTGLKIREGMTMCIEPMVNIGTWEVRTLDDNWTIVSADGSLAAHFEHTIAVTSKGYEILTTE